MIKNLCGKARQGLFRFVQVPVVGTPGAGNWVLQPAFSRPIYSATDGGQVAGSFPFGSPTLLYGFAPQQNVFEGQIYDPQDGHPLVNDENQFEETPFGG